MQMLILTAEMRKPLGIGVTLLISANEDRHMHTEDIEQVVSKLRALPPERLMEVEDFIDFVSRRTRNQALTAAAMAVSEPVLEKTWNNDEDAVYDEL
jgi:hypothetical protein